MVEIIRPVLKTIERYGKVVGTAIQHSPEVAALVWAGIELILSVRFIVVAGQIITHMI